VRDLVWRWTGWDFAVLRDSGSPWARPRTWAADGERIVDAGRCRLTITPPWPRRALAMRAERARSFDWRIQHPAEGAARASDTAPETGRRRQARPR
jgi:hypothetical protein